MPTLYTTFFRSYALIHSIQWFDNTQISEARLDVSDFILYWYDFQNISLGDFFLECSKAGNKYPAHIVKIMQAIKASKKLILTLSKLDNLDNFLSREDQFDLIYDVVHLLQYMIESYKCEISIDISEVFLVENGQIPPDFYHPERDRIVQTLEQYQEETSKISYRIGKAFAGLVAKPVSSQELIYEPDVFYTLGYSGWLHCNNPKHVFPHNDLTHFSEMKLFIMKAGAGLRHLTLRLASHLTMSDLLECQDEFRACRMLKEVVIILTNKDYLDPDHRQAAINEIISTVITKGWRFFPHIFFMPQITNPPVRYVHELRASQESDMGCLRLLMQENPSYYVSDERLFAAVTRNIQIKNQQNSVSLNLMFDKENESPETSRKISNYIIQMGSPTPDYRKSKKLNARELRAGISFSVTHEFAQNHEVTQTQEQQQEFTQQQEVTQTQALQSQQQAQTSFDLFRKLMGFNEFMNNLFDIGWSSIHHQNSTNRLLNQSHYFTSHYVSTDIMKRLTMDSVFREKVTSTIFGRFPNNPMMAGLQHGSFVYIDNGVALRMLDTIYSLLDGMDFESLQLEKGVYSLALTLMYRQSTLIGYEKSYISKPTYIAHDYLGSLGNQGINYISSGIQTATLLRPEDVATLTPAEQENWAQIAADLLRFFKPLASQQELPDCRLQVYTLYQYLCSESDLSLLNKVLYSFSEFTPDYTRIFLWPIIMGYRYQAQQFLILLSILDNRGLLTYFSKIYIEYALTIDTLFNVLQAKKQHSCMHTKIAIRNSNESWVSESKHSDSTASKSLFFDFLSRIPVGSVFEECPPFEKFVLHFMLYASKYNIDISQCKLVQFQKFWQCLDTKLFHYHHGDRQAVDQSLAIIVTHLICPNNGLVIAPVCLAKTVFDGIEKMIEHGIRRDSLEEIIREWRGLSLLRTDALYAALDDNFTVVTHEMRIEITSLMIENSEIPCSFIDHSVSSYRVYESYLRRLLDAQCQRANPNYELFTIIVFRYLGKHSLREQIEFYRGLLKMIQANTDPAALYFSHLLFGYWVLTKTGEHYTRDCDSQRLHAEFLEFLLKKNYIPANNDYSYEIAKEQRENDLNQIMYAKINGEHREVIEQCVQVFCQYANAHFPEQEQKKHESLWCFYQKKLPKDTKITQTVSYVNQSLSWLGLANSNPAWETTSIVNQSLALVGLANHPTFETIPQVFKKRFSIVSIGKFFVLQQAELSKSAAIFSQYPHIVDELMIAKIKAQFVLTQAEKRNQVTEKQYKDSQFAVYKWLKQRFQSWTIDQLITNISESENLIAHFSELALEEDYLIWKESYLGMIFSLSGPNDIKIAILLLNLISQQRHSEDYKPENMQKILQYILQFPELSVCYEQAEALLPIIISMGIEHASSPYVGIVCGLAKKLNALKPEEAATTLKILLSFIPWEQNTAGPDLFYLYLPMTAQELHGLSKIIQDKTWDLAILGQILQNNPGIDLCDACKKYQSLEAEHRRALCQIVSYVSETNSEPVLDWLEYGSKHPKSALLLLNRLIHLYQIDAQRASILLKSSHLKQDLKNLEKELYAQNLERYHYNRDDVARDIDKIRKKSRVEGEEDQPLSPEEQKRILDDYELMMSYMQGNPVLMATDEQGVQKILTIHELDEEQCQFLYRKLSKTLQESVLTQQEKHAYRLVLLGLCSEVHWRTTKKFPRHTQMLCELHALDDPQAQMQEVKTSGGKSIISELRAVTLCAEGWTVDIATENIELACVALRNFKPFYEYLNVPHAQTVIKPNSTHRDYVPGGIHHSTPAYFTFFRACMALKKKSLPKRVALLCDEIDAILTTIIQYRLAGVIDPIYSDTKSWTVVFTELLNFVQEPEIFQQNNCDAKHDVHNFKFYFAQKQTSKALVDFVEKIPDDILDGLLNSARIPEVLSEGEDYLPIEREYNKKPHQYAAPIMKVGTKRPEAAVSISEGGQQILHTAANAKLKRGEFSYVSQAITETLMIISAKNFFDSYPLVMGWTGTPGSQLELQEFYQENGLEAYYYPIYQPDRSTHLGVEIAAMREEQFAAILARICQQRTLYPKQPQLIFLDSPKIVGEFQQYLKAQTPDLLVQSYDGYETEGMTEKELVKLAGQEDMITLSTLSLSRGTDFETAFPFGFGGTGGAADVTESDVIQMEGRVARDGKLGQFGHIICAEDLDPATADIADPSARFKAHQRLLGQQRQRERLKTRFLENARYFIVKDYFLKMRQEVERIMAEQQGIYAAFIPEKEFLKSLRDFNKQSEKIYMQLLGTQAELGSEQQEEFIQNLIGIYQTHLDHLIPNQTLEQFQVIEPLIALPGLQNVVLPEHLKLQDLRAISDILSSGWRTMGHQSMSKILEISDDVLGELQPYFDEECSFRVAVAQILERRQMLQTSKIVSEIDNIKVTVTEFNLQDMVNNIQTSLPEHNETLVRGFGQMLAMIFTEETLQNIKSFVLDYLEETKNKIAEKRWDDLTLPDLQVEWIQTWISRINTIWTTFGWITFGAAFVAGPTSFILTRFVFPAVLRLIKHLVKRWFADSESTVVQVLLGLDNAFDDLSRILNALYNKDLKTLTIDELLQDFMPILNNKAIQMICNKMLENQVQGEQFFQVLPDLVSALEPYRHLPVKELKRPEIIMTVIIKVLQSDFFKHMMDEEEHALMLERIRVLPPNFSTIFKDCSLPQLMTIFKVLAHPRFNQCLTQLPPEAGFTDLQQWLQANPNTLPMAIQNPIRELQDYQNNHERIAQDTQATFKSIKRKFHLLPEDLKAHHAQLSRRKHEVEPSRNLLPATMWEFRFYVQWAKVVIPYVLLLVVNYFIFNFSVLLITGVFVGLLLIPVLQNKYVTWMQETKVNELRKQPIVPFVMPITPAPVLNTVDALHEEREQVVAPSVPRVSSLSRSSYTSFSIFGTNILIPDLTQNIPSFLM